jgi:hypothetical protein
LAKSRAGTSAVSHPPKVAFIEDYILGIMAHFTDIVDNSKRGQSASEKRRALKAIKHLIILSESEIDMALPQVSLLCMHPKWAQLMTGI